MPRIFIVLFSLPKGGLDFEGKEEDEQFRREKETVSMGPPGERKKRRRRKTHIVNPQKNRRS